MFNWNILVTLSFKSGLQTVASIVFKLIIDNLKSYSQSLQKSRYAKVKMNIQLSHVYVQSLTMQAEHFFFFPQG